MAQAWDGALALARYLCHFPDTIQSKCTVVKLGSGHRYLELFSVEIRRRTHAHTSIIYIHIYSRWS